MRYIRRATLEDRNGIVQLRVTEFGRSREFALRQPEKLAWSAWDDQHSVLAAWDGWDDRDGSVLPVSTMRAVLIHDAHEAAQALECIPPRQAEYPALIFNSAATRISHRGLGLNQALRYHYLKGALSGPVRAILSPIYEGAPRIAFMTELGYIFKAPDKCWQSKLAPRRRRIVGVLHRAKMASAVAHLRAHRHDIIQSYAYQGPPLDFGRAPCEPARAAAIFSL